MKKILEKVMRFVVLAALCCGMLSGITSNSAEAASKKQAALKAYKEKLNSGSKNDLFFVYDLNHDGVPELVLREGVDPSIYTYYKNKVVKLRSFASGGILIYYKKGNVFASGRLIQGRFSDVRYTISKGEIKTVAACISTEDGSDPKYYVGGKKTTKKKYEKYIKKMTKKSKSHDFDYSQATPENIKKYLK